MERSVTDKSNEPVRLAADGEAKVKEWRAARRNVEQAKAKLREAESNLTTATNDLARWLMPKGAKPGEKFCVWWADALIEATVGQGMFHEVNVRSAGPVWREASHDR
jgi:hypothetical protein